MNIHGLLKIGDIIANDEALDVLIIYNEEDQQMLKFVGNEEGDYELADTLMDVDEDDESLDDAVDTLLDTPE